MADFYGNLKRAIQWWASRELKIPTIYAEQYEIRPEKPPYAVIRIGDIVETGLYDESGEVDENGIAMVEGHRQATIEVEIIGVNAMEICQQLQASLSKVTVMSGLWNSYGVAILNRGNVENLTELLETKGLERSRMEVRVGYAVEYPDDQGRIERVEVNGEIIPIVPPQP